jgi:hypothetical protein
LFWSVEARPRGRTLEKTIEKYELQNVLYHYHVRKVPFLQADLPRRRRLCAKINEQRTIEFMKN